MACTLWLFCKLGKREGYFSLSNLFLSSHPNIDRKNDGGRTLLQMLKDFKTHPSPTSLRDESSIDNLLGGVGLLL